MVAGVRTAGRKKRKTHTKRAKPALPEGHCALTRLATGQVARAIWQSALEDSAQRGLPCTVALLDVDAFSHRVDDLGRSRSDLLLRDVAARLRAAFSDAAFLGRLGGDQFGVALPGVVVEEALSLLEAVRQKVAAKPFKVGRGAARRVVELTLSAGVAGLARDGESLPELLESAQAGLRKAQDRGGNRLGLPGKEKMVLKTSYYRRGQLDRLKRLAAQEGVSESVLLRQALEDLLLVYKARPPVG